MFEYGILPPLMFLGMIIFMLYGFPVAFSLATVGLVFGVIGIFTEHFSPAFLQALPLRIFGIVSNDLLLHSFLHLHGRDPGAMRACRRFA